MVALNRELRNRKPQPSSFHRGCGSAPHSKETFEDALLLTLRYPWSLVLNGKADQSLAVSLEMLR
jgi:hypothetical protein